MIDDAKLQELYDSAAGLEKLWFDFKTSVFWCPPSPRGLLPGVWVVEHYCRRCTFKVRGDQLLAHALQHVEEATT